MSSNRTKISSLKWSVVDKNEPKHFDSTEIEEWIVVVLPHLLYIKYKILAQGSKWKRVVALNHDGISPFAIRNWNFLLESIIKHHKKEMEEKEEKDSSLIYLCIKIYCRNSWVFKKSIITICSEMCRASVTYSKHAIWVRLVCACVGVFISLLSVDRKWSGM